MFKARDYLNKNCLSNLYHTYIFPYLIYCIEVLGNASHCHLLPLFLTQKKIIRLITFSKHLAHTEPLFKSLNILPLNSLYYHRIGLLMYKLSNGLLPEALNELYIKRNKIHNYPTRNCDKYHIQTNTDSFSNVSARIWNVIKTNIDMVPTGPGNREKSGNLTWVPPGPGKVRLFINICSNPGKVRDFSQLMRS